MVLRTSYSPVPWWDHRMSFGSYLRFLPGRVAEVGDSSLASFRAHYVPRKLH